MQSVGGAWAPDWLQTLWNVELTDEQKAVLQKNSVVRELVSDAAKTEVPIWSVPSPSVEATAECVDPATRALIDSFGLDPLVTGDWYGSTSGDLSALRLLQSASEAAAANPFLRMLYQIQHNLRFCPNAPVIISMLLVRSQWRTFLCLRLVPTEKWRLCEGYKCGDSVWRLHEWRLCGGYKIMYQYRSLSVNRLTTQL